LNPQPVIAVILASGSGERLDSAMPKQFLKVAGKTLVEHTLDRFESHPQIDEIVLVVHPRYRSLMEEILLRGKYGKVRKLINGGASRQESSTLGVSAIEATTGIVLIHDAVRPFVSERIIADCVAALAESGAVDTAIPATDTIVQVDAERVIRSVPKRKELMRGQTPQGFRLDVIRNAHRRAAAEHFSDVTDDCSLVLKYGLADIVVVAGEETNIKVTYPEDIYLADRLFQLKRAQVPEFASLEGLSGRVIVVFGASRGIGAAICDRARILGARVHGFSRQEGVDVASTAQVAAALASVSAVEGRIDAIVNTAGIMKTGLIETRTDQDIQQEILTNYWGTVNVVRCGIPALRKSGGHFLMFSSSAYTRGRSFYATYSSSKAAVVNFVQAMAEELAPQGIRINVINPERTDTPMRRENFGQEDPATLLRPTQVAEAALKTLLSDLTGQVIDVRRKREP